MAPAFGPGHNPRDPGSNPTSGSRCMEPASPSAYVSASLSLSLSVSLSVCDYHKFKKFLKKLKKILLEYSHIYLVHIVCDCFHDTMAQVSSDRLWFSKYLLFGHLRKHMLPPPLLMCSKVLSSSFSSFFHISVHKEELEKWKPQRSKQLT